MPLKGFESLCGRNAARIVSKDKKNKQYHQGNNRAKAYVTHYKIDGVVIKEGRRCDYLLLNEDQHTAYLIELKGSKLDIAAKQLEATETILQKELVGYEINYRIVANKCKTQAIRSSTYRKYQDKWGKRIVQKTGFIEEGI